MKFNDKAIEKKVLDYASTLLFSRGVKGWNMDVFCKGVGLAKNTLYKIISSKEDLIERAILQNIKEIQNKLIRIIESHNFKDALEQILLIFPELLNNVYSDIIQSVFTEYPGIEDNIRNSRDVLNRQIIQFIQNGIDSGELKETANPESIFEILQAVVIYYLKSGYSGQTLTEKISYALSSLIYGIKKE